MFAESFGDSQQACSLAAFHNSGAAGIPLKRRLPSGGSQSVPWVGRRTLKACKAGVTWTKGGRPKQDPVSETEENEVYWEGPCLLQAQTLVLGTGPFGGKALCCREQRLHPLRADSTALQSLLDHHWEQQSSGGLNHSDFSP